MSYKSDKIVEISRLLKICPKSQNLIPEGLSLDTFCKGLFLMPEDQLDKLYAIIQLEFNQD